jgi:hypothetical protein
MPSGQYLAKIYIYQSSGQRLFFLVSFNVKAEQEVTPIPKPETDYTAIYVLVGIIVAFGICYFVYRRMRRPKPEELPKEVPPKPPEAPSTPSPPSSSILRYLKSRVY